MVAIGDLDAHRAARGDGEDLIRREFALGEDVQHLAPDIAGRADDGDFIAHDALLLFRAGCMGSLRQSKGGAYVPLEVLCACLRGR